ncbi:6-phosphogluconolactonase [Patescibacteria group bacterium]|nr:6-phosphogluconolactonase [Patescibacteria group bacterium]
MDMVNELAHFLVEQNVLTHIYSGVSVVKVVDQQKGFELAPNILSLIVDKKSVLYLSGGNTPKELYSKLAREESVVPGAVGMVDERYGLKLHENSNEKMIRDTGFLRYLEMLDIPFYPILQAGLSREETAREYDAKLRSLQSTFPKHIGILGIGADGHIAGIPAEDQKSPLRPGFAKATSGRQGFAGQAKVKSQKSDIYNTTDLVVEYNDESGRYGERVTMTFMGLTMMDILLVLVFGSSKARALELVFQDGSDPSSPEEVPGRFYKRPEIARKTLMITDQEI